MRGKLLNLAITAFLVGMAVAQIWKLSEDRIDLYGIVYLCLFGILCLVGIVSKAIEWIEDMTFHARIERIRKKYQTDL